jgi:DNA-binding GntR family transcriptional regulator
VAADQLFHQMIVAASDNPILLDLYAGLRDRQQRMGLYAVFHDDDRLRATNHQHVELVDLLERGDVAGYRTALRGHLRGTRAAALGRQDGRDRAVQDSSIHPSTGVD